MGGTPPSAAARSRSLRGPLVVATVVVVLGVTLAGLYVGKLGPFASHATPPPSTPQFAGAFTGGAVVTLNFTGAESCAPSLLSLYPSATAAAGVTGCEVDSANQNQVPDQVPQWILVPAFAGMSVFGLSSLGASSGGFGVYSGSAVLTDCPSGAHASGCADTPGLLYSPTFVSVERDDNLSSGVGGEPTGVLPAPAFDTLLNTSGSFPNVEWGSIYVFVFDPNIFPDRANATCTKVVATSLANPTGNCLSSMAALQRALATNSSGVLLANGNSPLWRASGSSELQAVLVGGAAASQSQLLNSNVYVPYSVAVGAPSSFPG